MPETKQKICFVVSPIGDTGTKERIHADWLLDGIIKPVFETHFKDYKVERSDKVKLPGMIDSQVINRLHEAELVIVDMSLRNPNVFYEMGIRHMKRLPIIHMFVAGEEIPFDVKPHRAIPFKYAHPDDLREAQAELKSVVDEIVKPGFVVENPVTRARGFEKLEESGTEKEQLFADELRAVHERLRVLENRTKPRRQAIPTGQFMVPDTEPPSQWSTRRLAALGDAFLSDEDRIRINSNAMNEMITGNISDEDLLAILRGEGRKQTDEKK